MLNNLAEVFRVANRLEDALKTLDRALAVRPQLAEAHYNRALVLQLLGRSDEAMIGYERALRENPQHTAAMVNLGNMLQQRGDLEGSEVLYSRAVEVDPMHAEALRNLGLLKQNTRRVPEALVLLQRAVAIRPDFVEALDNLGSALQALGRPEQAIVYHQRAAEINPAFAVALNNLGNALLRLGRGEEAVAAYRKAVVANPDFSDAHYNIGSVAQTLGWLDEAVEGYRRRVALKPDDMAAINNLANILKDQAKLDEALDLFRRAAAALNESGGSHDNALYTSLYSDSVTAEDSFAEHLRWGQRFADPLTLAAPALENDRDPQRRIRIGYVSPYFRAHALGILLEPLVARHDKERFEVFFYSDTSVHDEANTRYRTYADAWRETTGVPDPALAEMIRHDRIDVLIDLNLHMAGSRLMAFARKPAPVQISYLAYPATSGMAAMDYLITDPYLDPPDRASKLHRERLLRLPQAYWCYLPMDPTPEVGPLPADEVGYITFGSYNNFCKLNPRVARTWGQILGRVPQARLRVLIVGKKDHNLGAGKLLTDAGIDAHRLELVEYQPRLKYLEEFNRTDIVLDPFPCNGHTSSLDALWMGVPVVTLEGQGAFGRAGVCLNRNLGLDDLIASNESEYIEKAVKLQEDRPRLRWLRSGLRQRFKQSPLYDAQRTTRALESLYRQAWSDWCAHAPPVRAPSKPALSVCVALKDRSRRTGPDGRVMEPFPQCVKSLAKALPLGEKVELVVADFSSRDWPLEQWLDSQAAGMSVKILPIEGEFLRGRARNEAAKAASADTLFFCDADMLVPPGLLSTGLDMARRGMAFFPVCQLTTPDGALGAICATGYGNTFISRARFEKAGGWPEFKSWGGEDNLFWDRCYHDGEVSRIVVPGFLHQWHPLEFRD
ncbi:MAG: tetratricopeptide repeat protein, partial [Terriglobales bacterium]